MSSADIEIVMCPRCGYTWDPKRYDHSAEECDNIALGLEEG